ncbi:hypothetical protein [Prosthecobacter sp.]|uniref:hypothetical protein n=1 Tax=Prosthecobacter sp. TaxID=1965333 RepID=UPI0025FDD313|nr:hypothetical protein [Prosthecobacter sp.]
MRWFAVLFVASMCAPDIRAQGRALPAREFLTKLEEARAAIRFEDRLRTHEAALDAILESDAAALEAVLVLWNQSDEFYQRNVFARMAWTCLAQIDTIRALKLLENAGNEEAFNEGAREVWAEIARTDPARAYIAAQSFAPKREDQHERKWLVQHIMQAVGGTWFRATGLATLKRLPTLSHPDLMATAVFHGCVSEAKTAEQKIALLDRFCGDEKPVIEENHIKSPDFCEELVESAALADLPGTRAWIEKRFPPGTKRPSNRERDWHIEHARRALFRVWKEQDALEAADWFITQQHRDEGSDSAHAMYLCALALAGEDLEELPAALAWMEKQARPQDRVSALVNFLDDDFGDHVVLRQSRQTIAAWLAKRPMAEREAVVLAAAKEYIRLQSKDDFLPTVFPNVAKQREMGGRLEKITGSPSDYAGNSFMLRAFDLPPVRNKTIVVSVEEANHSRELARLHELARTAVDPSKRREGLEALKWMKSASPDEIRPVLLARLQNHEMDWFSEDLLSAWVLQDWRACEAFAMNAPFSVEKRDGMLIHIFCEAAELHPDAVLARLRELLQSKVLVQAALDRSASFSRVSWKTIYYGDMITHSLARGLLRQGDMQAFTTIQTLPVGWQGGPLEVLGENFTTVECGSTVLDHLERQENAERQRHPDVAWAFDYEVRPVLGRLTSISPEDAVKWLEARPEKLGEHDDMNSLVHRVHSVWRESDPKAADAWMERLRREHPARKADPAVPVRRGDAAPLQPRR